MSLIAAMKRCNFYIPPNLFAKLQEKAKSTQVPMSEHVRAALTAYLNG